MSSVLDKFEQELKNTNIMNYIESDDETDATELTKILNRRTTLHRIIDAMKTLKLSESIWNKFNHEEIEEIADAFSAVLKDFREENKALYQTIQDWEDWADSRPY
tara:strand:+ start:827 stop:1141 length:315 start_codon:yes stop_codon:yes gene_type:complete